MNLIEQILKETDWLYVQLFHTDIFFFDLWSVVHLWSGFSMIILLHAFQVRRVLLVQVLVLIAYEIIEILILWFAFSIFNPETIKDQFTDIFIGFSGGVIAEFTFRWLRKIQHNHPGAIKVGQAVYIAITYSFIWVGFYGYSYNLAGFNSTGINYAALTSWILGSLTLLLGYLWLRRWGNLTAIITAWGLYLLILGTIEYITYNYLGLHEISKTESTAMVFGIIHGLPVLHVFYLIAPGILILMFWIFRWICSKALRPKYG